LLQQVLKVKVSELLKRTKALIFNWRMFDNRLGALYAGQLISSALWRRSDQYAGSVRSRLSTYWPSSSSVIITQNLVLPAIVSLFRETSMPRPRYVLT